MRYFSKWLKRFRWSIDKVCDRIQQLPLIYDVRDEQVESDRYLVHVWINSLSPRVEKKLLPELRKAVGGRPRHIKLDILLYRREAS